MPGSAATGTPSAIPYRHAAPVSAGNLVAALAITTLVLVALIACVAYARRRGWLPSMRVGSSVAQAGGIEVRASRRLSMATTTHVITYEGRAYLIVESGRGHAATVSPVSDSKVELSDKP